MDYHIMEGYISGDIVRYRVAFHIAVPDVANDVNVNYREIISTYCDTVSAMPDIDAGEQTQLTNGELYEDLDTITAHINNTQGLRQLVEDWYTGKKSFLQQHFQQRFQFTGAKGNVG